MARLRYGKKSRYRQLETGSWVPEDEPDSAARRLHKHEQTLTYHVKDWALIYNVEGFDQTKEHERFVFHEDQPGAARIRCYLENDRRTLWSLREDGIEEIEGDLELRIVPIGEKEIEGYIRHDAPDVPREYDKSHQGDADEQSEAANPKGTVSAALGIPTERFEFIVRKLLEAPDARLTISLSMPLYKEEIAQAFDEYWMSQEFMIPYDDNTPINAYQIHVAHGPGLPRLLGDVHEGEGGDPVTEEDNGEGQRSTYALGRVQSAPASARSDKRLDYILWLLAALVAIQLFRT